MRRSTRLVSSRLGVAIFLVVSLLGVGLADPAATAEVQYTWKGIRSSRPEPARSLHGMAYDEVRDQIVVFGGNTTAGMVGDTWTWDGTAWTQQFPATSPSPRWEHAMAADPLGRVVLFGGSYCDWSTGTCTSLGDTWTWDGTTWTQQFPATSPPPGGGAMAYDPGLGQVVFFGGPTSTTWVWDGLNWTPLNAGAHPEPRGLHAMTYDSYRGEIVMFGGNAWNSGQKMNDTWVWDGAAWVQLAPTTSPSPRYGHAMASDGRREVILYGGAGDFGGLAETWAWDGNTWAQQFPTQSPPPIFYGRMASDGANLVLYGGSGTGPSGINPNAYLLKRKAPVTP